MSQTESTYTCDDCRQPFGVTAARRVLTTEASAPTRCPACRVARQDSRKRQLAAFWRTN